MSPNLELRAGFALLLCLILASPAAFSQNSTQSLKKDYALIYGTVWGPDAHPVAGVPIKIRKASDKKAKWQLTSDARGEFAQRVPVGTEDYVVQADVKVPKGQPQPQTTVHIDHNERQDVSLHLTQEELSTR